MQAQSKKCKENPQQPVETSNLHIKQSSSKNTQKGSGKKAIPQVGPKTTQNEEVKTERKSNAARSRRRCIVDENDSPTKNLLSKFKPITTLENATQQENTTPNSSEINNAPKRQMMPDGARGRRLRKLMIEQNCPRYGGMTAMRKKEIIYEPEEIQELNEVIEKRCCICLEEMKAKTRPEECSHVFCRTCITAWTDTFSNLCPLCKIEIKYLLIYKERPDFEEGCEKEESIENDQQYNTVVVDKIKVTKPVINDQISDWVQSFADHCYVCNQNDNEPQLLVCDKCNFNICHTYCCGLQSIPEDEWFCQDCLAEMEEQEKRKKLIAERRRKTRLQNQAKKRKMIEEQIGGSGDESSTESQEQQDDITAKLKQSDIYNESDEDDHIIKPLWKKPSSQSTSEVNDAENRKVLESKFAKKKRFTSSLIADKKENQEPKRITTSSLEMLRGQNQKREDQWLQAEHNQASITHRYQQQPSKVLDKKPQPIQKTPPSSCLMMINPQNALNTYIPPFKTTKFGNSLKLTAAVPPRVIYNHLLQHRSNDQQEPAAKAIIRKSKSQSEESNDGKKSTGDLDDLDVADLILEDQKAQEQPPKQKKKGITFKDPTPQKEPKVLKKIGHDFDIFEIISPQKPSIQIVAGTSSAAKATYANLIDSSNIINGSIRYRIQQQQQLHPKKQQQTKPTQHQSEQPSQPKKKKQAKKRAKKADDEVEEIKPKNQKIGKQKKKVAEKEQAKKKQQQKKVAKKMVDLSDEYNCSEQEEDEYKDDTFESDENLEDEVIPPSKKRMQKAAKKERGNKRRIDDESD